MGRPGQNSTGFSISDAFEEEDTDEVIKVYGNASPMTMNGVAGSKTDEEGVKIRMEPSDSNRYVLNLSFNSSAIMTNHCLHFHLGN